MAGLRELGRSGTRVVELHGLEAALAGIQAEVARVRPGGRDNRTEPWGQQRQQGGPPSQSPHFSDTSDSARPANWPVSMDEVPEGC